MYVLRRSQLIRGEPDAVFRFFESPRNLQAITPPWLRFEILRSTDESMRRGTLIKYRISWLGIPINWRTRIAEYDPPHGFVDEMVSGPYRRWHHRHLFEAVEGGVEMTDVVEYALPWGPLGWVAHRALVRPQLESIFDYRRDAVDDLFSARYASAQHIVGVGEGGADEPDEDEAGLANVGDQRGEV